MPLAMHQTQSGQLLQLAGAKPPPPKLFAGSVIIIPSHTQIPAPPLHPPLPSFAAPRKILQNLGKSKWRAER